MDRIFSFSFLGFLVVLGGLLAQDSTQESIKGRFNAVHPLDPLTPEEMELAVEVIRGKNSSKQLYFPYIYLNEPPKKEVLEFKKGDKFSREAFVNVLDREDYSTYEVVVDLNSKVIKSNKKIELGQTPLIKSDGPDKIEEIIKSDPRWQKAMRDRGFEDFKDLRVNIGASINNLPPHVNPKNRQTRALTYWKGPYNNTYSNVVEGVVVIFDITENKISDFQDYGVVQVPKINADFDRATIGPDKNPLKPLVVQENVPQNFTVNGNEVTWYRWKFRYALHPREGLVIHRVSYDDRPVLYRGSVAEVFTPYGENSPAWTWRMPMDEGEYALGSGRSLTRKGIEVPANATLIDTALSSSSGIPVLAKEAIAIYEIDGGVLWRHDEVSGVEARRGQNLVIEFVTTLGNYDFSFSWVFYPDGRFEPRVSLMGILQQKPVNEVVSYHGLVAPKIMGPLHQHFFCYRLDFEVDGTQNTVVEMDMVTLPKEKNPAGTAWDVEATVIKDEKMGIREIDVERNRSWRIINPNVKNELGFPVGYDLMVTSNTPAFFLEDSPSLKRVEFVKHPVWVTAFNPGEFFPAGDYPRQGPFGEGLPKWIQRGAPLENSDLVVWYVFGMSHHTRPEDWPVMPTKTVVPFSLMPAGFFVKNPVLDFGNSP